MMAELGEEVSNVGIARRYAGLCDTLVIDASDAHEAVDVERLGVGAYVTSTVMASDADKAALADSVLHLAEQGRSPTGVRRG